MDQTDLFNNEEVTKKIAALDELFNSSRQYKNSKEYFELIKFIARFPKLSPFNAFLVHVQNNGVQLVMTEGQWRKHNRKVIPYSRPLVILRPFGPVLFVYDIAQTEGAPIPEALINPFSVAGAVDPNNYRNTINSCEKQNIIVKENELVNAAACYAKRYNNSFGIRLNNTWDISVKYSTLIHELGHIFCGHLGITKESWWKSRWGLGEVINEIEAESISFLVCRRQGLEPPSASYLSTYIQDDMELPAISFDTILNVSGYIEQMKEYTFAPRKPLKKTNA